MDACTFCEHKKDYRKGLYTVNPCEKIETHYNPCLPKPKKRIFTITEPKREYMHHRFPYDIIRNR